MVGVVLVMISLVLSGTQFVTEEKIFSKFHIEPLEVVGWEGIWGILIAAGALIPIAAAIPCDNAVTCPYGYLEAPFEAVKAWEKSQIIMWGVAAMLSLACYNFFGMSVTKYMSSLTRYANLKKILYCVV